MMDLYFEDLNIGDKFESKLSRILTEEDNIKYVELTEDYFPSHLDKEFNKKFNYNNVFISGNLLSNIADGLAYRDIKYKLIEYRGEDKKKWKNHLFPGDRIYIIDEIINKNKLNKNRGLIKIKREVKNQKHKLILSLIKKYTIEYKPNINPKLL